MAAVTDRRCKPPYQRAGFTTPSQAITPTRLRETAIPTKAGAHSFLSTTGMTPITTQITDLAIAK